MVGRGGYKASGDNLLALVNVQKSLRAQAQSTRMLKLSIFSRTNTSIQLTTWKSNYVYSLGNGQLYYLSAFGPPMKLHEFLIEKHVQSWKYIEVFDWLHKSVKQSSNNHSKIRAHTAMIINQNLSKRMRGKACSSTGY